MEESIIESVRLGSIALGLVIGLFCTLMLRFLRKIRVGCGAGVLGLGCIAPQGCDKACMYTCGALEGSSVAWIAQRLDNERRGVMNIERRSRLMLQSDSPIFN